MVDTCLGLPIGQREQLYSALRESFPEFRELSLSEFITEHGETQRVRGQSYLVLNRVIDDEVSSIVNTPAADEERTVYSTFFAAYTDHKAGHADDLDVYTLCKIKQLNDSLAGKSRGVVLQGFNVDEKLLTALDYITELQHSNPEKFKVDRLNSKSKLKTCFNQVQGKIKRTETELWLKEALANQKPLELGAVLDSLLIKP